MCAITPVQDPHTRRLFWDARSFEDQVREFIRIAAESDWPADRVREELCCEDDDKGMECYLRGVADAYELLREVRP